MDVLGLTRTWVGGRLRPQTNIMYQNYMLNRDTSLWGDDALVFDPDRWTDDRTKKYEPPRP
jgi:cytochrome P450